MQDKKNSEADEIYSLSDGDDMEALVDMESIEREAELALADAEALEGQEHSASYGDMIIEELSAESNARRVSAIVKKGKYTASYVVSAIYLIVGVLCVTITDRITEILPYVVGSMMLFIGVVRFIIAIARHEYRQIKTNQTATSLIVAGLGAMIIMQEIDATNDSAIMLISVVWGILGLFEGAHAFNHAFMRLANSERCIYFIIKGLLECVVAFMLLYRPDSHEIHRFHIMVFGVNLIVDAITMIPQVKAFLTK